MPPYTFIEYLESNFLFNIEFSFQYDTSIPTKEIISDTKKIVKNYIGNPGYKSESKDELGYGSNNFTFSDLNVKKCIQMLNHLKQYYNSKYNNYYNNKDMFVCKYFDINYTFPLTHDWTFYWLICHLSLDDNMIRSLSKLTVQNSFFNRGGLIMYNGNIDERDEYLYDLLMDIRIFILNQDYHRLSRCLLRIPKDYKKVFDFFLPQKTGIWEGPNDFLNNIDIIKSMLISMNHIANWMAETSKSNELNGLSKSNFYDIMVKCLY